MKRSHIGIEPGEHCYTHRAPRLKKVIEGEQEGISKALERQGGGGFRYYRLGLQIFDEAGHIHQDIRFSDLAAHIRFSETLQPWHGMHNDGRAKSHKNPLLGIRNVCAYALPYNGFLGVKRANGGNVLTRATLGLLRDEISKADPEFAGSPIVYGQPSRSL